MIKNEPSIVIADLKYPMNLGSIARTMYCCGYKNLNLVRPCEAWNGMDAIKFSLFAKHILEGARVYKGIEELKEEGLTLFGFSRRIGKRRNNPLYLSELGSFMSKFSAVTKPGFVFGGESNGLSTEDLKTCDYTVSIDTEIVEGSLSLPVAVAIVMYDYKRQNTKFVKHKSSMSLDQNQAKALFDKTKELLKKIDFIDNKDERRVMVKLKDIYNRLSVNEIKLLHSILGRINK